MTALHYKHDWDRAKQRWTAFWDRLPVDRPCLDVQAPRESGPDLPTPPSQQARWLDPDYVAERWLAILENTYYAAEAVPTYWPLIMAGWTLGCSEDVVFNARTIYHPVVMSGMNEPLNWDPGPSDPWRAKLEKLVNRLLDMAPGRFLVGYTLQLPINDLLTLLRGVDEFLADLGEDCDACCRLMDQGLPRWIEVFEHFRDLIDARQTDGHVWSWPGLWSREFVMITQSDMSCMISEDMFGRYVMRELNVLGDRYERIWYHLDGRGAKRHLKKLLEQPYIKAIQYIPSPDEPPSGPAHMDLYRQVQSAGRCLELYASADNIEYLIRHLRPEGLILRIRVGSPAEADELLANAVKWCGTHVNEGI